MPRPRLPHLHRERGQWVFRVGHGPRIKLTAPYGSKEFGEQYQAALRGEAVTGHRKPGKGTLSWLWGQYRESLAWQSLSAATKRQRENIMRGVIERAGREPFEAITRRVIVEGRDRRADTPSMARHFVDTMRGLFKWALDAEHVESDPTRDVSTPKKSTDGHHTWTVEEIRAFHHRHPLGTRERVAFDLLLYTGLRRGDAVIAGKQHVRDGVLTLKTEKTGETARIVMVPALLRTLEAGPVGDLAFIVGERGGPMSKEAFGNWFGAVCKEAGLPGTAHGLRKALATILAENGASVHELEALFTWRGGGMAGLYTRKANRANLARSAMGKAEQTMDVLFPHSGELWDESQKN